MASTVTIPPLNKIFLVGLWTETALWGVNNVVFIAVCYVLFWRPNSRTSRWVLGITSLLLYLCATLHVAAALRQGLEAFIYVPSDAPPQYTSLYYAQEGSSLASMKNSLYTTAVFIQDLVLIWRMYMVWGRDWRIIVIPLTVELVHIGCAYAAVILLTKPDAGIYSPALSRLGSLGWPLELVVNICATSAIASRLWYMGRRLSKAGSTNSTTVVSQRNAYVAPIFTIVESGAILVVFTIVMLILYKTGNPAALMCTDIAIQIAALVPYLIIVRVGLGLTHGLPSAYKSYVDNLATTTASGGGMNFAPNRIFWRSIDRQHSHAKVNVSETVISTASTDRIALSEFEARMGSRETVKWSGPTV